MSDDLQMMPMRVKIKLLKHVSIRTYGSCGILYAKHRDMALLNTPPPSIEPTATGHIIEQIQMIEILANGYAYEVDGNVYFDVVKYNKDHAYGKLSGRNIEDICRIPVN